MRGRSQDGGRAISVIHLVVEVHLVKVSERSVYLGFWTFALSKQKNSVIATASISPLCSFQTFALGVLRIRRKAASQSTITYGTLVKQVADQQTPPPSSSLPYKFSTLVLSTISRPPTRLAA